jgi:two-component system chemotaxis response regulator CheB
VFRTYDALAAGAVDVLEKPLGVEPDEEWERRLIAAVHMVSRIRVITHPRARLGALGRSTHPSTPGTPAVLASEERRIVAIGTSTGGPGALLSILGQLPRDYGLPILIVLHISEPFALAMAEWLDAQIALPVRYATDGQSGVWMAPPGRHLAVAGGRLRLQDGPERHSCRPSVDVLFESLALEHGPHTVACLLTGMGRDGAKGLLDLKHRGALTLVQDEATSVVFGMPGEAVKIGAACRVLPLSEFGAALRNTATNREGGRA